MNDTSFATDAHKQWVFGPVTLTASYCLFNWGVGFEMNFFELAFVLTVNLLCVHMTVHYGWEQAE